MIKEFTLYEYDKVTSTQTVAKELITQNSLPHAAVVIANIQSEGRGRYNRVWVSPEGGLYLTIHLKPQRDIETWPQLSYVVGVSLCEAIRLIDLSCNPTLKWVNDILINSKKVAGILLEVVNNSAILVGIGVNIKMDEVINKHMGTSLEAYSNTFTKAKLMEIFFKRLKYNYNLWCDKGFEPIRALWVRSAYGIGKEIEIKFRDHKQKGIFLGIDEIGKMQFLENGEVKEVSAGEIFLT